jgi:hypothetical protein
VKHWVVVETGANQAFIFASNRQAANVGASELVRRAGTDWVDDAVRAVTGETSDGVDVVVRASGKALLLVDDVTTGRSIVRHVTRTALEQAPGLEVWGIVDPAPVDETGPDLGHALSRAHRLHAQARSHLTSPLLRHPTLPYLASCTHTDAVATRLAEDGKPRGNGKPRGAGIDAAWRARNAGRTVLVDAVGDDQAVPALHELGDGITEAGWVAVLHADGNRVGSLFMGLPHAYSGQAFRDALADLSTALDEVTKQALRDAVAATAPGYDRWLLPLVVGGDDVTALVDGRVAFALTTAFLRAVTERAAADRRISDVLAALTSAGRAAPPALTASAGLVFVKAHHPFSDAYQLAEDLCEQAKRAADRAPGCGALDVHVLHDSVGTDLDAIRSPLKVAAPGSGDVRLWAGPFVVPTQHAPAPTGSPDPWVEAHDLTQLTALTGALRRTGAEEPVLSSAAAHDLRAALVTGGAEITRARRHLTARSDTMTALLDRHLVVDDGDGALSRLVTALDLLDVEFGTARGRSRLPALDRTGDAGGEGA